MEIDELLKSLAQPAQRALLTLNIQTLEQLSRYTREQISKLHGIGPNALKKIEAEMDRSGIRFKE